MNLKNNGKIKKLNRPKKAFETFSSTQVRMQTQTQTQTMQLSHDYWNATAAAAATQNPPVTLYGEDGNTYHGHVNSRGAKHGQGTLKTDFYITGIVGDEQSHQTRWTEFSGNWDNGLMHGHGVMRHMFYTEPDGNVQVDSVAYDGMWDNGVPVVVYDDAYYNEMYADEIPQRGDYDHSEEAS